MQASHLISMLPAVGWKACSEAKTKALNMFDPRAPARLLLCLHNPKISVFWVFTTIKSRESSSTASDQARPNQARQACAGAESIFHFLHLTRGQWPPGILSIYTTPQRQATGEVLRCHPEPRHVLLRLTTRCTCFDLKQGDLAIVTLSIQRFLSLEAFLLHLGKTKKTDKAVSSLDDVSHGRLLDRLLGV